MKKFFVPFIIVVFIGLSGLFVARFLFGGDEDTWICSNNQWVRHGHPTGSKPLSGCGEKQTKQQTFNEAGLLLTFEIPLDTTFRKEIADDGGRIRVASFYVEKGDKNNPTYQLYAVYQPLETVTEKELDRIKTGMSPNSIKEVTIDGYKGIEGLIQISGPKNHYATAIVKNGKLFTISTYPPTKENKQLTDQIISTFKFK
jgi:hypothetical protein